MDWMWGREVGRWLSPGCWHKCACGLLNRCQTAYRCKSPILQHRSGRIDLPPASRKLSLGCRQVLRNLYSPSMPLGGAWPAFPVRSGGLFEVQIAFKTHLYQLQYSALAPRPSFFLGKCLTYGSCSVNLGILLYW